jgi:hypothetical protein
MNASKVTLSLNTKIFVAIGVAAIIAVFTLTPAIPQDPAYHLFIDQRGMLGIPNFWNVISNLPFLIVGIAGLSIIFSNTDRICVREASAAYVTLFTGIVLTAIGSAYYHLAPSNEALVWDRLPMTIGFAGLFCVIIAEFISATTARRLLLPLLIIGFGSVEYWAWTESQGAGDLRPYALVQFLPMLLIPVILLTHKPVIGATRYFWWMLGFYGIAKLFEFFDAEIFALGGLISGHSLKHVAAAMTPAIFAYALFKRR